MYLILNILVLDTKRWGVPYFTIKTRDSKGRIHDMAGCTIILWLAVLGLPARKHIVHATSVVDLLGTNPTIGTATPRAP
jgi:hypothetical protein